MHEDEIKSLKIIPITVKFSEGYTSFLCQVDTKLEKEIWD